MSSLEFEIEWSQADDPDARRAATAAEIVIQINGTPATRLSNSWSKTTTDRARLPLYPLAEWLATNWWRLHAEAPFETDTPPPLDWRLSHDLGSVGAGFVWPRIRFVSDGPAMLVSAKAWRNAPFEPVRYLNDVPATSIAIDLFDHAVEGLVEMVLRRLSELNVSAEPLATIWADVQAERADPEVRAWCWWEARLGYNVGEASKSVMHAIDCLALKVGQGALGELAPLLRPNELESMKYFEDLAIAPGAEAKLSITVTPHSAPNLEPWQVGRELAHAVRAEASVGDGPIDDRALAGLLGMRTEAIQEPGGGIATIASLGVRHRNLKKVLLHFRKKNVFGRRFEVARFLADSLIAPQDTWLPLTDRATRRQQIQRSFATELLAPIEELTEFVGNVRSSERIEDAADFYRLSPLAIRSHFANHGLISRDEVTG